MGKELETKIVISAKDRASRVMNRLTGDLSKIKPHVAALNRELRQNNLALAQFSGGLGRTSPELIRFSQRTKESSAGLASMGLAARKPMSAMDQLTGKLGATRASVAALDRQIKRNNQSLSSMGLAYKPPITQTEKLRAANTRLITRLAKLKPAFTKAFSKVGGRIRSIKNAVFSLHGAFVGFFAVLAARSLVTTASEFENLRIQLDALQGSSQAGAEALAWVKDFAINTPLSLQEVTRSFVTMRAFGLDPMSGQMLKLVDASSKLGGGSERLTSIVRAVGQMFTKGKIQAEEMNRQLTEVGVPAWDLLSKAMKLPISQLQDMASKGELGRKEIMLLIDAIGDFGNGAALANMKTFTGLFSNFGDQISQAKDEFAKADEGLFSFVKGGLEIGIKKLNEFRDSGALAEWGKGISNTMLDAAENILLGSELIVEGVKPIFDAVVDGAQLLIATYNALPPFLKPLGMMGGFILGPKLLLAGALILGAIDPLFKFLDSFVKKPPGTGAFVGPVEGLTKALEALVEENKALKLEVEGPIKQDNFFSSAIGFVREWRTEVNGITQEIIALRALTEAQARRISPNIKGKSLFQISQEPKNKQLAPEGSSAFGLSQGSREEGFGARLQAEAAFRLDSQAFTEAGNQAELEMQNNHLSNLIAIDQAIAESKLSLNQETIDSLMNMEAGAAQARINQIKQEEAAKKRLRDVAVSQTLGGAANMFNALFILTGSKSRSLFKVTKDLNLAEAITSGIAAISKAASALPWPANVPGIAAMTGLHLSNVARIQQTTFGGGSVGAPSVPTGGGGGGGGISVPTGFPVRNQNQGAAPNITIHINAVDAKSFEGFDWSQVAEPISEAVGNHVADGGQTGDVQFLVSTRGD